MSVKNRSLHFQAKLISALRTSAGRVGVSPPKEGRSLFSLIW